MSTNSTSSKYSILSNVSSLAAGGIFENETDLDNVSSIGADEMEKVGPEMGHVKHIKNKQKRTEEFLKLQYQKRRVSSYTFRLFMKFIIKAQRKARKERAKARLETGEPTPGKNTIESMRKIDETIVEPDDAEVEWEEANDELESHFNSTVPPKVLLMTRNAPNGPMKSLCKELLKTIPNSTYLFRQGFALKKLIPVVRFLCRIHIFSNFKFRHRRKVTQICLFCLPIENGFLTI